jgi:histone H3/H4
MNEKEQNGTELTKKQISLIPTIVSAKNVNDGVKKAKIGRTTYYNWMKNPKFRDEIETLRKVIVKDAISELKQSSMDAVKVLKNLLESDSEIVKLRTAKYIIESIKKFIELEDIEERLEILEQKISVQ